MTGRSLTCEDAALRLLEVDDGPLPPELASHVAECAECALVVRDVAAFRALVAEARADVEGRIATPDVLARLGSGKDHEAAEEPRPLRLVHGGASEPIAAKARPAEAPRRILPIAVAIAAGIVAVTAATVLLRDEAPRPDPQPRVVLRATGEHPDQPARAPEPVDAPAIAITAPAPAPTLTVPEPTSERGSGSKEEPAHARRGTPSSSEAPSSVGSNAPAPQPVAGTDPDLEAQRTLRRQMPRLQNCYERALRRDLRLGDATADLTVDISPDGGVRTVSVSGNATPELRRCLEQAVRNARFPGSDSGLQVSVPLRFEVVRERMGTNIAPHGTVRQ